MVEKREVKAWITRGGKHIPIFEDSVSKGKENRPHTYDSLRKEGLNRDKARKEYEKQPWKEGLAEKKVNAESKFTSEANKGIIKSSKFKKKKSNPLEDENFSISERDINGKKVHIVSQSSKMNGIKDVESHFKSREEAEKHVRNEMAKNAWTWDNMKPEDKARAEKYDKKVKEYDAMTKKKSIPQQNEDIKQKQLAEAQAERDRLNGKKSNESIPKNEFYPKHLIDEKTQIRKETKDRIDQMSDKEKQNYARDLEGFIKIAEQQVENGGSIYNQQELQNYQNIKRYLQSKMSNDVSKVTPRYDESKYDISRMVGIDDERVLRYTPHDIYDDSTPSFFIDEIGSKYNNFAEYRRARRETTAQGLKKKASKIQYLQNISEAKDMMELDNYVKTLKKAYKSGEIGHDNFMSLMRVVGQTRKYLRNS